MRNLMLLTLFVAVLAGGAVADVVYLRDGKKYEGKVTRKGDKVIVEMNMGTLTFPMADVIHIEKKPLSTQPARPGETPGEPGAPLPGGATAGQPLTMQNARRPEPIVFMFMRTAAGAGPGTTAVELQRSIQRWQAAAHDRKRNIGANQWIDPEEFIRRHKAFLDLAEKAEKKYRQASYKRGKSAKDKSERRSLEAAAARKLQQAAKVPADPMLRAFLMGAAALDVENYPLAETKFRSCIRMAPRVAAFHQGRGLALLGMDRPLAALETFTTVLRLRPNAAAAVELMRKASKKAPGARMNDPRFVTAKELLGEYEESKRTGRTSRTKIEWLLPGKTVRVRDHELPKPSFDRLDFRQGVAVPVGPSTLLVDAEVVKDALDVFVRVDPNTLVRGVVKRTTYYGSKGPPLPVALVDVEEYVFTPVEADPDAKLENGQAVSVRGMGLYQGMGSTPRGIAGQVLVDEEGKASLSASLVPGEAGSCALTDDGKLVGFLAGKTDPMAEGGGPDRFYSLKDLEKVLKRVRTTYRPSRSYGYGRAKRNVTTRPAEGRFFIVHAICGEKFGAPKRRY